MVISAGFKEIEDSPGAAVQDQIKSIAEDADTPVIGSSTFGMINFHTLGSTHQKRWSSPCKAKPRGFLLPIATYKKGSAPVGDICSASHIELARTLAGFCKNTSRPIVFLIPLGRFSAFDSPGGTLEDKEARKTFKGLARIITCRHYRGSYQWA